MRHWAALNNIMMCVRAPGLAARLSVTLRFGCLLHVAMGCGTSGTRTGPTTTNEGDAGNRAADSADASASRDAASDLADVSSDSRDADTSVDPPMARLPVVVNGSFEDLLRPPACYGAPRCFAMGQCVSNMTNEVFNATVVGVQAYGDAGQIDLYHDCHEFTPDGVYHVGLAARPDGVDAITLELSEPLTAGGRYRLVLYASHAAATTVVKVGISDDPQSFGSRVGNLPSLSEDPEEVVVDFTATAAVRYLALEPERVSEGFGWPMIDDVRLELSPQS